jgi:hypothetical protein
MSDIDPKFVITQDMFIRCQIFGDASVSTSADKYANRNQYDIEKIKRDIRNGKIGEIGAHQQVDLIYPGLSAPDFQIYQKGQKSWATDLINSVSGLHLAVKTQDIDSAIHFGDSWVFQGAPGKTKDTDTGIFKNTNPNHYVSFVSLNTPKKTGKIRAIVKVSWLIDNNLFKAMQKEELRDNKVAVYYDDLLRYPDQLWQL